MATVTQRGGQEGVPFIWGKESLGRNVIVLQFVRSATDIAMWALRRPYCVRLCDISHLGR